MDDHTRGCVCCAAGGDMTVVDAQMAEVIQRCGWAIMRVPKGRGYLAYTLGLGLLPLPELYMEGDIAALMAGQLNALATQMKDADAPWEAGDVIELAQRGRYRVEEITTERLPMAERFYGRPVPAWRMRKVG